MARVAKRARRRLACRILTGRQSFSGVILDLSASGIFVQTNAKPRVRDAVTVEISVPGHREALRVEAQVARVRLVPSNLVTVAQGGVGLRITNAPEGYFAFLSEILPEGHAEQPAAPARPLEPEAAGPAREAPRAPAAPARRRYRVRMSQLGGARSRTLHVEARSSEEAAHLAYQATGDGWKLIEASEDDGP